MSTTTKTNKTTTSAKEAPKTEAAETKVSTKGAYRLDPQFLPALKSAKALAKGNPSLGGALQLITHIAWKRPQDSVGWTEGTTASVIDYANDIAVPVGTPIKEAFNTVIAVATKAVQNDAQKEALAVLVKIIRDHESV